MTEDATGRDQTQPSPAEATPSPRRAGPSRLPLILVSAVAVLALILASWALLRPAPAPVTEAGKAPIPGTAAPAAAGSASASVDTSDVDAHPLAPTTGEVDGISGLYQGTARVASGNSSSIFGVPTGWPQSIDGSVSAAMNYMGAELSLARLLPATEPQLHARTNTAANIERHDFTQGSAEVREQLSMNANGEVVRNGKISADERVYVQAFPRYGVYKVLKTDRSTPTAVTVRVWFPGVKGVGTVDDLSNVALKWYFYDVDMLWSTQLGDWQIDDWRWLGPSYPPDQRRSNQPWAEVRKLLGPGWIVPADGTEEPYPGALLTK